MWKLVLIGLVALATAEVAKFNNYKVFRVVPQTEEQLQLIRSLEDVSDAVCKLIFHEFNFAIVTYGVLISRESIGKKLFHRNSFCRLNYYNFS